MLNIDSTIFIQVINFLIIIAVLNWLLVKPTLRILEERRVRVEGSEEEAGRLTAQADKNIQEYEQNLNEARISAGREKERIRMEGIERENEIIKAAREQSRKTVEDMKTKIEKEAREASTVMKQEVKSLSLEIAEKVLGRSI
ncbi:MAG: ATP synthase F0 subunit B [Deltaproteobacteria bacterium]|nr:ATP synthase F0 subunit B [Candidatus Zymogenaceae bacterium]